jgi:hypothetical protein
MRRLACLPDMRIFLDIINVKKDKPPIPRSNEVQGLDTKMVVIKLFLILCKKPVNLSDEEFKSFVHYVARFFILEDNLWHRDPQGKHQLVVDPHKCYRILKEAHNDLGHKGVYTVHMRFWWPHIIDDIKWYAHTCHECQVQHMQKLHIPPTVPIPGGLFRKVHIDIMKMPHAGGFEHLMQVHCALTEYPEWCMLRKDTTKMLQAFIFEELLCRWGPITEIVTDNVPTYRLAVDVLAAKYGVHPIRISPYNSQANGIVKHRHCDVQDAIMKTCEGDDLRWYQVAHSVFWAEHVTVQKVMGLSPYFMVHGVEPIFPFDLAEATFLVPLPERCAFTTTDLIAWHVHQLQKRTKDLTAIKEKVLKVRYSSIHNFKKCFCTSIKDYNFVPGALVLV